MEFSKEQMINQLRSILPYPVRWYEGLADKRLKAIHRQHLSRIISEAIIRDENNVRKKANLPPVQRATEQLTLF